MAAGDWSSVIRMNKDFPRCRVVPHQVTGTRVSDYWDDTTKRWKSGVVISKLNAGSDITWAAHSGGAATATETLAVRIAPPNFNAVNDYEYVNAGYDVGSVTKALSPSYKNICAVNYGQPGPSAQTMADGTVAFTAIDLELASNAFTEIVSDLDVTIAGNLTTTSTGYSNIATNSGTGYTMNIAAGPLASKYFYNAGYLGPWGMVAAAIASNYTTYVVQIQSIVTQYFPGPSGQMWQPILTIANPAQSGGQQLANWRLPIPMAGKSTNTIAELAPNSRGYTYVFAVNAGSGKTVDANAVQIASLDVAVTGNSAYNLCNIGIELPDGADGTAAASVVYEIATHAGL